MRTAYGDPPARQADAPLPRCGAGVQLSVFLLIYTQSGPALRYEASRLESARSGRALTARTFADCRSERYSRLCDLLNDAPAALKRWRPRPSATVFQHACRLGLEGIVAKKKGSIYRSGRCSS